MRTLTTTDELLAYIFDGQPHLLAPPMADWLSSSRRFTTFVTTFRDKIRKKLRVPQDQERLLDLRLELETAYLLLRERSLNVEYEPHSSEPGRSPDFAVHYTTSLTFTVEVTRLHAAPKREPDQSSATPWVEERPVDAICSKLGQLLAQQSNVLLVGAETLPLTADDLRATMVHIQQRAAANDSTLLNRHHFRDRGDFFSCYQRLSEILVRAPQASGGEALVVWVNPQAKRPLPSKVRTALYRSHGQ